MGLHQLITLLYLSAAVTFTCARRVCHVKCPAGEYFDQAFEDCRSCYELCSGSYKGRVVYCNNLCRSHCDSVTARGDDNTKCFSSEKWEQISQERSLPCSTCCVEDHKVCSRQVGCDDCSSFCSIGGGGDTESCHGYCRDWCDKLKTRERTAEEEKDYGLCFRDSPPIDLLQMYKTITEPTSGDPSGSAQGPDDDDDEDGRHGEPETNGVTDKDEIEGKVNATLYNFDGDFIDVDPDENEGGSKSDEKEPTSRRIQYQARKAAGTVVKRGGSFNTQWLLWIIGGCAILLLLVNGILLAVMLKQRTKPPPESHQATTHTNRIYGTSTAEEEKKKLISDVESQSSESMGGGSRSRCESEKTESGDTDEISHVSENGGDERKDGEDGEEEGDTESPHIYSYIDPEAARKAAAAGSSDEA